MLEDLRLKVFDIKSNDINGASKQYYISHETSIYKENSFILKKIKEEENKLNLSKPITYKKFITDIKIHHYLQYLKLDHFFLI